MMKKEQKQSTSCRSGSPFGGAFHCRWHHALLFVALLMAVLVVTPVHAQQRDGIIHASLQRPKKEPVLQLAIRRPALKSGEKRRLSKLIRNIREDVQVVIGDSVDANVTTKEMTETLFENWLDNGQISDRGILILLAMEQNRIEFSLGLGLRHLLDEDWCSEISHAKMVPWFRENNYYKGLEETMYEIEKTLQAVKQPKRWRRRFQWAAGLGTMFGGWRYRHKLRYLKKTIADRFRGYNSPPPPPSPPPTGPGGIGTQRNRRRGHGVPTTRKRKGSKPKDVDVDQNIIPWEKLLRLFSTSFDRNNGVTKMAPGQTNVNVFYPPPHPYTSPEDPYKKANTEEKVQSSVKLTQENEMPPSSINIPQYSSETNLPLPPKQKSLQKPAIFSKPKQFRPIKYIQEKSESRTLYRSTKNDAAQTPSRSVGGGASWSTVTDRQHKEAIVAKTSSLPSPKDRDSKENSEKGVSSFGAGASWSKPSDRTGTNEVVSKTKNSAKSEPKKKNSFGTGATWSSLGARAPQAQPPSVEPKSFGDGASW